MLSLDPNGPFDDVTWDRETMEDALRDRRRGERSMTPTTATPSLVGRRDRLEFVVDRAPVGWLVDRLPIPGG